MTEYSGYRNVSIIHPESGAQAQVPDSALAQYYQAGWTLLAAEGAPPRDNLPPDTPEPQTASQVAEGLRARAAELAPDAEKTESPPHKGGSGKSAGKTASASTEE